MNILDRTFLRGAGLVGTALLAAACGGGGGDSGSSAVVVPTATRSGTASASSDLTQANAGAFVGVLARSVMGAADGAVPVLASSRESPMARASGAAGGALRQATRVAARMAAGMGREAALGVIVGNPEPCGLSGTVTVTFNDADDNQRLSRGDSVSIAFVNCAFDASTPAINGSLSFVVNAVELDSQQEPTALDATITLSGFAEAGFGTLSGSFRIWYRDESPTSTRQRISYIDAAVNEQGQALIYNFDVYGVLGTTSASFDLNGALTVAGTTYAMATSTVFSQTGGTMPGSGAVELRDAAGDRVIVRARSGTTFDLEFQAAGAATPTVLQAGLLWSNYRLGTNN